jgi:hypothetical protein
MKKIILSLFIILTYLATPIFAGEGMWLPLLLKQLNEKEMQAMGMKITAEDIYSINKGSLKDAIVQFGGGCTASLISNSGLLLTNHHCGFSQIQQHSTLEHNYVEDGFWSVSREDERACPGLTVMFIVSMEEVTGDVLKGVTPDMNMRERQSAIDKNIAALSKTYKRLDDQDILVRSFYQGNQYYLFVTETYRDVRLVGAPPSSIGNFGVDTDNWVWPRHTGDFSLFRIYAGKNNRPADYSPDNKPYIPKHYLPVSLDGIEAGDFTMVFGFPGRTNEYLPSSSLEQTEDLHNPARIAIRGKVLEIMHKYMTQDESIKLKYVTKAARVANFWKKMQGESEGLKRTHAIDKRLAYENEFTKAINANPSLQKKYSAILPEIKAAVKKADQWVVIQVYASELMGNIELLRQARRADKLLNVYENNNTQDFDNERRKLLESQAGFFKNYVLAIDRDIFRDIVKMYVQQTGAQYNFPALEKMGPTTERWDDEVNKMYDNSLFAHPEKMASLADLSPDVVVSQIKNDPAYQFSHDLITMYNEKVVAQADAGADVIDSLMTIYMRAQMEAFPKRRFYPDANSTLRVTYGKVNGYKPRDAVEYLPQTFLDGVMEKYKPGDYEFDVSPKLIELYQKKDFGPYGVNGKMPVCFIASNHTTGGNSGSPVIDAYGNLIGLNFDRTWEGTMSDLNYDVSLCRNIMVDARYLLFIIDKIGGAKRLVDEMTLVHPKAKVKKKKK